MVRREQAGGLPAPVLLSETFQCREARKFLPLPARKARRLCRASLDRLRPSWETGANCPFFQAPSSDGLGPRYSALVLSSFELCDSGFNFGLARLAFAPTRPADRHRDVVTIQQAKKRGRIPLIRPNIAEVEFGSLHVLTEAVLVGGRLKTKKEHPLNRSEGNIAILNNLDLVSSCPLRVFFALSCLSIVSSLTY